MGLKWYRGLPLNSSPSFPVSACLCVMCLFVPWVGIPPCAASVSDAVRSGFRQSQAVLGDGMNEDVRIELALKIHVQCTKWKHLLAPPERPDPFQRMC